MDRHPFCRKSTCEGIVINGLIHFKDIMNGKNGCDVGKAEKKLISGFWNDVWIRDRHPDQESFEFWFGLSVSP